MNTNNSNEVQCPVCKIPLQDGVCPRCGMKEEDIKDAVPVDDDEAEEETPV
jgi:hypothetical protein